ncbi:MAG: type II toxin-antitoxin system RelB/DinJ family antitoxin [Holophagaceae bacterium]|nr:type II toxin-antitoxin system RelB/DinJ family antitoxin [Holophagaceae bacterium]
MPVQLTTRVDEATRAQFNNLCQHLGTTPSNTLSILVKDFVNRNGHPLTIAPPKVIDSKEARKKMFGCMRGQFDLPEDFNEPMEEFQE